MYLGLVPRLPADAGRPSLRPYFIAHHQSSSSSSSSSSGCPSRRQAFELSGTEQQLAGLLTDSSKSQLWDGAGIDLAAQLPGYCN